MLAKPCLELRDPVHHKTVPRSAEDHASVHPDPRSSCLWADAHRFPRLPNSGEPPLRSIQLHKVNKRHADLPMRLLVTASFLVRASTRIPDSPSMDFDLRIFASQVERKSERSPETQVPAREAHPTKIGDACGLMRRKRNPDSCRALPSTIRKQQPFEDPSFDLGISVRVSLNSRQLATLDY